MARLSFWSSDGVMIKRFPDMCRYPMPSVSFDVCTHTGACTYWQFLIELVLTWSCNSRNLPGSSYSLYYSLSGDEQEPLFYITSALCPVLVAWSQAHVPVPGVPGYDYQVLIPGTLFLRTHRVHITHHHSSNLQTLERNHGDWTQLLLWGNCAKPRKCQEWTQVQRWNHCRRGISLWHRCCRAHDGHQRYADSEARQYHGMDQLPSRNQLRSTRQERFRCQGYWRHLLPVWISLKKIQRDFLRWDIRYIEVKGHSWWCFVNVLSVQFYLWWKKISSGNYAFLVQCVNATCSWIEMDSLFREVQIWSSWMQFR